MSFNITIRDLLSLAIIYPLLELQFFWAVLVWYIMRGIPIQNLHFSLQWVIIYILVFLLIFIPFVSVLGITFSPLLPILLFMIGVVVASDRHGKFKIKLVFLLAMQSFSLQMVFSYTDFPVKDFPVKDFRDICWIWMILEWYCWKKYYPKLRLLSELEVVCAILIIYQLYIILGIDIILSNIITTLFLTVFSWIYNVITFIMGLIN